MRWLRLLLLGLAAVYPLYWTAQFLLYFVPETLAGYASGYRVEILDISYLQILAVVRPHAVFPTYAEVLMAAVTVAVLILVLNGGRFLTGSFAIAVMGQAALLPFLNFGSGERLALVSTVSGSLTAFALILLGLHRVLERLGGRDFYERLALLTLFTILPEAALYVVLRLAYPYFDARILLALIVPLFLAAVLAALLPARLSTESFGSVPWGEILASSAVACLLILAISLSSYSSQTLHSQTGEGQQPISLFE